MTVRLRLQRIGRVKRPYYRVVVIDQRAKVSGKPIEIIGQYDSIAKDGISKVNLERANYWLSAGAKASETVKALIKKSQTKNKQ
ncbi:MAG: 30S ribosomal protein S16 [Endomicrobium sp.]|jgi:small subunit ribosomal protein S16|nr:30S ribosomal protein S16 [Endomicrobium sp.]